MSLLTSLMAFGRFRGDREKGGGSLVEWLVVGLGNPGDRYAKTRHNIGRMVAESLVEQQQLGKVKPKYRGRIVGGPLGPGLPRVAVLVPETFMNESGQSVGPARGDLRVEPDRVIVIHDEIDFPFGRIESRIGGGTGGHNGLKSIKASLGTADFRRIRVGVGRPDSTDPEIVSRWVLGRFGEGSAQVESLIGDAVNETLRTITEQPNAEN